MSDSCNKCSHDAHLLVTMLLTDTFGKILWLKAQRIMYISESDSSLIFAALLNDFKTLLYHCFLFLRLLL